MSHLTAVATAEEDSDVRAVRGLSEFPGVSKRHETIVKKVTAKRLKKSYG